MNVINNFKKIIHGQEDYFLAIPALLWQIIFFYIPLLFIIALSFVAYDKSQHIYITFAQYTSLFNWVYIKILLQSVLLALSVASLCLLVGYPMAYYVGLKKRNYKNLFLSFLILPFWTNILIHIYAWFFVLEKDGLLNNFLRYLGIIHEPLRILNSMSAVVLVMFYCYLPFMILPLFSILEKFDTSLIEASMDLGANTRQTFFKIIFPLSLPGVRTGFFLVFVPAFGEFIIPMLLGGDKNMFVGSVISHYFLVTYNHAMGAAFTVISSIVLVISSILLSWLFFRQFKTIKR